MTEPTLSLPGQRPSRKLLRLRSFDYGSPNAYFITVATYRRRPPLAVEDIDQIALTKIGHLVSEEWRSLGARFPSIGIDEFILSGFPHVEECDRVASDLLPVVRSLIERERSG